MVFNKIAGILMFLTGIFIICLILFIIFITLEDGNYYADELFKDTFYSIAILMVGGALVYFPYTNIFGTGYINKSKLDQLKKENEILKLKIEQEKLNKKLFES
jgi:hypothetical protein